jgi:hypothetical protein
MATWISKPLLSVIAVLTLSGCDDLQGGFGPSKTSKPQVQALMMDQAVTLVAPGGYCIDPRSLRNNFALMARCDVLSAHAPRQNAPLAVITASLVPATAKTPLPSAKDAENTPSVTRTYDAKAAALRISYRAQGPAPTPDLDDMHWRATALVDGHLMALALYFPKKSSDGAKAGRRILNDLIDRTLSAND